MNYKDFKKYVDKSTKSIVDKLKDSEEELAFYTNLVVRFNEICEENEKLKKQLEEKDILIKQCDLSVSKVMNCYCERTDCSGRIKDSKQYDSLVQKVENQQQEFISYLEDKIKLYDEEYDNLEYVEIYEVILQKYKEIVGVSKIPIEIKTQIGE